MNQKLNPEILDRLPPQDKEAERHVIGSILLKSAVLDDIGSKLKTEHFYVEANKILHRHAVAMHNEDRAIDITTMRARLQQTKQRDHTDWEAIGGGAYLATVASVPSHGHASHYADLVIRAAQYRAMIAAATDTIRDSYAMQDEPSEILNRAEAALSSIQTGDGTNEPVSAFDATQEALEWIEQLQQRDHSAGVMTGLYEFDHDVGGLFREELNILAARPGAGKSALAMQIAAHNAAKGRRVYFASMEMSRKELMTRMMCSQSGVNNRAVRGGNLSREDQQALVTISADTSALPMFIHDHGEMSVYDIRRAARRLMRDNLELVVIDYLQLIQPENPRDSRQEQVAKMARRLKALARELKIPVLCLCQLNRESEKDKYPKLSHLRESGAIEQDADVVMLLSNPDTGPEKKKAAEGDKEEEKKQPQLNVAKNRNGPTGTFALHWVASETRFWSDEPQTHADLDAFADPHRSK